MSATAPPVSLTTFVGREQEVVAIRTLLGATRLLTLTGAGGSGKTRLASEVAARVGAESSDGVIWVELAPLHDPELLPGHVFAALGIEQGSRPALNALIDTLRDRTALVVLDNCEHLVTACAQLADALLRACPRLRILATSREALGIGGERAWLVPGLSLPNAGAALDASPLAARLDDSFRILGSGPRTAVPRHRTLREAIDWSYTLLDERERTLLRALSAFAGEFSLEAAESVCARAATDRAEIVDALGALVDKSLVVMREVEGSARYHLLETIRQYAREKLEESSDADDVR